MAMKGPIMGNVLVIDDESDLLFLCRINLTNSGMAVSCAGSGHAGLQAAFDQTPDAVVLDLMMPQMDGFEVLRPPARGPANARRTGRRVDRQDIAG